MKLNRRGLIGTIIYHILLLLLLVFAGLTFPDPPPADEGILVNFGTDETGFGDFEPEGDDQQAGEPEEPVVQESEEIVDDIADPVQEEQQAYIPPEPEPDPPAADQTQDVEEVQVKEESKPTPEELERQRQAELEKQRLEDQRRLEEQKRQEELERQRIEQERIERERQEQERIERERREQAERLNNRLGGAFNRQGEGDAQSGEGITEGEGNQGVTTGSPDANRYDTGGGLGDGISFGGLGSRKAMGNLPLPNMSGCDVTQKIEVKVEIQVDREGKVISAIVESATYQDNCIWTMVVQAAKQSRFSVDRNANYRQTGWIRYIIVP